MPPDPTPKPGPPSAKPPRRRPGPGLGGNWLWLVILLLLVGMFLVNSPSSSGSLKWGDFIRLVDNDESAATLRKVALLGTSRVSGEFDMGKVEELKKRAEKTIDPVPADVTGEDRKKKEEEKDREEKAKKRAEAGNEIVQAVLAKSSAGKFSVQKAQVEDPELVKKLDRLASLGVEYDQQDEHYAWLGAVLMLALPAIVLLALFLFLLPRFRDPLGGGFLSNYIKSPAKRYERTKGRITFEDVAGMQNAKSELQEIVEFLRSPERFARLGAVVPKGVLLVGPPGTGKTLLAKAVAGEAGVPFYSISGSEFIQMFVGVGASRVRDMFKTAKDTSPCILFIDEIDAVGRMRGAGVGGGSDEREQTLNQILSEMDGFTPSETVIVMAATNRPDVLDAALLRPGRFDRHVTIDRPTWQGRMAILKVHTRNKPLADDVDLEMIARKTIGMTGADLRNLANEAALCATRDGKMKIDRLDFERAADRVLIGPKREEVLNAEDKRRTAYHEAGHALVTWLMPGADKPQKVSIVPRGQSLGVNWTPPDEDRYHHGQDHFKRQLVMIMGGRAADRLVYGQPYAGAESDLKRATRLARLMVTHWGMSERLGPMAFRVGEEHVFLGKEIQEARDFSEATANLIDEEVQRILREADEQALELLSKHRDQMEKIVEALLQREELMREDIEQLLRADSNGVVAGTPSGITFGDAPHG